MLFAKFNLTYNHKKNVVKRTIFNFKNEEAIEKFKQVSNVTKKFENCFRDGKSSEEKYNKFNKNLDSVFHQTFKKIKIGGKKSTKNNEHVDLLGKRNVLKNTLLLVDCKIAKEIVKGKNCSIGI